MFGCVTKLLFVSRYHLWCILHVQSLASIQEPQDSDTLHHTRSGVAKEFTPWLQSAIDPDVMLGSHEEVAGLWRMVRRLLRDVVTLGAVRVVPVAGKNLSKDGVEWLLDAPATLLVTASF